MLNILVQINPALTNNPELVAIVFFCSVILVFLYDCIQCIRGSYLDYQSSRNNMHLNIKGLLHCAHSL